MSQNATHNLELFLTDLKDVIYHLRQTAPHQWETSATRFTAAALKMILIQNEDSHLELIYRGTDDETYHNWQLGTTNDWNGEAPY